MSMQLLEPGRFTVLRKYAVPVLTNLAPEVFAERGLGVIHVEGTVTLRAEGDRFVLDAGDTKLCWHDLAAMGISDADHELFKEGKFVYMKPFCDGFFLTRDPVPHAEMTPLVGADYVGARSAGFFTVTPQEIELYGKSVSLRDLGPSYAKDDQAAISRHLGLTKVVEVDSEWL